MERRQSQTQKAVAILLVGSLTSLVLLGSSAEPPLVEISAIQSLESGTKIELIGLLVELRVYDSGAEGLVVADAEDGCTARVVCSEGIGPQPSSYTSIGDELKVVGEVSLSQTGPIVFTSGDKVAILRESEAVLSVRVVSLNWMLFEGDTIRVNGILLAEDLGSSLRLVECSGSCSITVGMSQISLGDLIGQQVIVTAKLDFDHRTSSLVLAVLYAVPEP